MIVSSMSVRALYMARALIIGAISALGLVLLAASPATATPSVFTYDTPAYVYDGPAPLSSPDTVARDAPGSPSGPAAVSWVSPASVGDRGDAANTGAVGGLRAAGTNSVEILQEQAALEGLTPSQIDDLAVNAGYEILPGKVSASNPATRYYVPGTNRSVGFRVLPGGVAGQTGIKAGPYLKFFGGPNDGLRIPLGAS